VGYAEEVSRGPGSIQQEVLDYLAEHPKESLDAVEVAHWLSDVRYAYDTEPTRTQTESARRALKRLERDGHLVSTRQPSPTSNNPRRVYRLPRPARRHQRRTSD
jgi:hypothetical protein